MLATLPPVRPRGGPGREGTLALDLGSGAGPRAEGRRPRAGRFRAAAGALACAAAVLAGRGAEAAPPYTLFESGHVRPLALSPDGKLLFAVNTPDNRLEVFRVKPHGLSHRLSVPVGLEPVAVAARGNDEVWVVNHLSDSVSVVELRDEGREGGVARTLYVGDEPRDVVFAGPGRRRAFITAAHRGQNTGRDPQLDVPGVGRADVWVFDGGGPGASPGGDPLAVLTVFTDTPRALATSPDGKRVYVAGFHSGNQTTALSDNHVPDGFGPDGALPPAANFEGYPAPELGLILKFDGARWRDAVGRDWSDKVRHELPDKDVFVIDAMANPPRQVAGDGGSYAHVGTILYNLAVNPVTGRVYVSNTEANNLERGEGPGVFTGSSLNGRLHFNRITVLSPAGGVAPRHLNKHVDYTSCCAPVPNAESETSLALPLEMAVTKDGKTLYVAAFGSSKVGVFDTKRLEDDTFVPDRGDQIEVSGGGPSGLALDEQNGRLFVFTRFDNSIAVVDTAARREVGKVSLYSPEPEHVRRGRRFLYDARFSSSHGDQACASCHVFGDFDGLAWDLGNPDAPVVNNPAPFLGPLGSNGVPRNLLTGQDMPGYFHPLKGPMVTQSLRGMANTGALHWRGDRTGGNDEPSAQPDGGVFNERLAFAKFQGGFTELLRRSGPISDEDMAAFADFVFEVMYPPNPIRNLDNSLTADQAAGLEIFSNRTFHAVGTCRDCHVIDPDGLADQGVARPGFFGTRGLVSFEFQPQLFKVPQLRNLYQKVGKFGFAEVPGAINQYDDAPKGPQVRGFGFFHDGSFDTTVRFHNVLSFNHFPGQDGFSDGPAGNVERAKVEQFLMAFPSNLAPAVGQQVTLAPASGAAAGQRLALLRGRAEAGECDLVAKAHRRGLELGFVYAGGGHYRADRKALGLVPEGVLALLTQAAGFRTTYTCAPPGSGRRVGIDRDGDGALDGDERAAGSDPADPASEP